MRLEPVASLAALLVAGCSWGRFDAIKQDPPVVILERGGGIAAGFASSLAVSQRGAEQILLVGGQPVVSRAALWSLGAGEEPSIAPLGLRVCDDRDGCKLLGSAAAVPDRAGGHGCFVAGVGPGSSALGPDPGLLGACADGVVFKLAVPPAFGKGVLPRVLDPLGTYGFAGVAAVASDGPSLVAGSPDAHAAWAYDLGAAQEPPPPPLPLPPPADADFTFGLAVAVVGAPGKRLAAVSAPGQGRVYIYAITAAGAALQGCVSRAPPYGVVMTGLADGPALLLAVSDGASLVEVLDLGKIAPGCAPPAAEVVAHGYQCRETGEVTGCAGGDFGYALASGDLDGDGRPELLVGAPGLAVRGAFKAGAVQVFSLADPTDAPHDTLFVADSDPDQHVGMTLATARIEGRDIVVAGGPGKPEVAIFYCSALGGASSKRCR